MTRSFSFAVLTWALILIASDSAWSQKGVSSSTNSSNAQQEETEPKVNPKHMKEAVRALIAACHDKESNIRIAAINVLSRSKVLPKEVAKQLSSCFFDQDEQVAMGAIHSFSILECDNSIKIGILIKLLGSDDQKHIEVAEQILNALDADKKTVLTIVEVLKNKETPRAVKRRLFGVLQIWGPNSAPAIDALAEMYSSDGPWKVQILMTLRTIGQAAKPAVPVITKGIADKEANVRLLAIETLAQITVDHTSRSSRRYTVQDRQRFEAFARTMMTRYDTDRNGMISGAEKDKFRMFAVMDRNRDGRLTQREIAQYYTTQYNNQLMRSAPRRTTTTRSVGGRGGR